MFPHTAKLGSKPQEPSLKPPRIKPFNDSPRKPLLYKGKNAPTY